MKFVHSADLHLDSPFLGLKDVPQEFAKTIYQSTFQAFQNLVNDAIQFKVDFICISGDIFDRDQHSIAAESFFNEQCLRLEEARIPVYLSFGNHDYQKVDNQLQFPDNVTVFDNHVETKVLELAVFAILRISLKLRRRLNHLDIPWPGKLAVLNLTL